MINIRHAIRSDYPIINQYDQFMGDRREDIEKGELFVADFQEVRAVAYLKLSSYALFNKPLVVYLVVNPDYRRKGIAMELLLGIEAHVGWDRLFISTEKGNDAMHALLPKAGYQSCGHIDGLNEDGATECFFFKDIS